MAEPTFQIAFFVHHPTDISELPEKYPDLQEQIHNDAALRSLMRTPVMLLWGEVKQYISSMRIVARFQHHNCKPTSYH
jgi:hypothetical protein